MSAKSPVEQALHDKVLRLLRETKECFESETFHQESLDDVSRRRIELEVERSAIEQHMREQGWEPPTLVRQDASGTITKVDPRGFTLSAE